MYVVCPRFIHLSFHKNLITSSQVKNVYAYNIGNLINSVRLFTLYAEFSIKRFVTVVHYVSQFLKQYPLGWVTGLETGTEISYWDFSNRLVRLGWPTARAHLRADDPRIFACLHWVRLGWPTAKAHLGTGNPRILGSSDPRILTCLHDLLNIGSIGNWTQFYIWEQQRCRHTI